MKFRNIPIHLCCGSVEECWRHNAADVWFDAEGCRLWATDGRMALAVEVQGVQPFETSGPIPAAVFRRLVSDVPLDMTVEMLAVPGRVDFPGITKIGSMAREPSVDKPAPPFKGMSPPGDREEVILALNARLLYRLARAMPSDVVEIALTPGADALSNPVAAVIRVVPNEPDRARNKEVRGMLMPCKQTVTWDGWEDLRVDKVDGGSEN